MLIVLIDSCSLSGLVLCGSGPLLQGPLPSKQNAHRDGEIVNSGEHSLCSMPALSRPREGDTTNETYNPVFPETFFKTYPLAGMVSVLAMQPRHSTSSLLSNSEQGDFTQFLCKALKIATKKEFQS